jgi:DcuC family C4-dicarboxylate transporter
MSRGGDLGMMIMMLCGFATYMTHIGANDMVVKLASKPLRYINSPYLLMIAAYFVACLMSLAVSSATGLGVLLMATLFPVMVNVGISRGAAAPFAPHRRRLSSRQPRRRRAGGQSRRNAADRLCFKTTLPISIAAIICMAIAHFFWQRYLDKKENISRNARCQRHHHHRPGAVRHSAVYPIIGVLIFDGKWGRNCTLSPSSWLHAAGGDAGVLRGFNTKNVFSGLEVAYRGMADAFAGVVMLLVAAGVFAQG